MFFRSLVAVFGILLGVSLINANPIPVTEWNWTDNEGALHEYVLVKDYACSWRKALLETDGDWHLATVTSSDEQAALISRLEGYRGQYWLGGYQTRRVNIPSEDWAWVTGEEWEFKNWAPGEPNDYYGYGSEQYLAVSSAWGSSKWRWNDEGNRFNICGYVMERTQSVPEPGTITLFALGLVALTMVPNRKKKCS